MAEMKFYDWLAYALLVIGGLNWGLVGIANFNLVEALFGTWAIVVKAVYALVGLSAIYGTYTAYKIVKS